MLVPLQSVANTQLHKQELKQEQENTKHGSYHLLRSPQMCVALMRPYCNCHNDSELLQLKSEQMLDAQFLHHVPQGVLLLCRGFVLAAVWAARPGLSAQSEQR